MRHGGEILVSAFQAGYIDDADQLEHGHLMLGAGGIDAVLDAPPQPLVRCSLCYRQGSAKRQGQRFKQQFDAAVRTHPEHLAQRGLAVWAAIMRGTSACSQASNRGSPDAAANRA